MDEAVAFRTIDVLWKFIVSPALFNLRITFKVFEETAFAKRVQTIDYSGGVHKVAGTKRTRSKRTKNINI